MVRAQDSANIRNVCEQTIGESSSCFMPSNVAICRKRTNGKTIHVELAVFISASRVVLRNAQQ